MNTQVADGMVSPAQVSRLQTHADLLAAWLDMAPDRLPAALADRSDFARMVELVRTHLRPISSRGSLAISYTQEHFHVAAVGAAPAPRVLLTRNATEVAYALRWMELASGLPRPSWPVLTGGN